MGSPQSADGKPVPAEKPYEVTDADIDAVLAEVGGDPRAAIAALLYDIASLANDRGRAVSHGYVRGRVYPWLDTLKLP